MDKKFKLINLLREIKIKNRGISIQPSGENEGLISAGPFIDMEYSIYGEDVVIILSGCEYYQQKYLSHLGQDDEEYYDVEESAKAAPIVAAILKKYKPFLEKDDYGITDIYIPYENIKDDIEESANFPQYEGNDTYEWFGEKLIIKVQNGNHNVYDINNNLKFTWPIYTEVETTNPLPATVVMWAFKKVYPHIIQDNQ